MNFLLWKDVELKSKSLKEFFLDKIKRARALKSFDYLFLTHTV